MKEYERGLVSVVMPTYKRSEQLIRAIESVLNQSYSNLELLLVNDNEPGDEYTQELLKRIEPYRDDTRFKLVFQEQHKNGAVARNVGIKQSKGEYIAFLDDDDWWECTKLERQVEVLGNLDPTWGGVSCRFTLYNREGKRVGRSLKYKDGYIYKDVLGLMSDVATGTLLLRRTCLDEAGYFDEQLLRHQDIQLLTVFTAKFKLLQIDEFLHCVDVSDTRNRPNPKNIIAYKEALFDSVSAIVDTLSHEEKQEILAMHRFEIGYVYLKNGQYIRAVEMIVSILSNPNIFARAMQKSLNRIRQSLH